MTAAKPITLTQEEFQEYFDYDDGWLYRKTGRAKGRRAGFVDQLGYVIVRFQYRSWKAHRLIFFWHWGWMPDNTDHINWVRHDNRIENLRPCTPGENLMNMQNVKGYTLRTKGRWSAWQACVMLRGKTIDLGYYATEAEAHAAYLEGKRVHHAGA